MFENQIIAIRYYIIFLFWGIISGIQGYSLQAQITYIPDPDFEQALIDLGIDSDGVINGQVLTSDIENVESLNLNQRMIRDFTGIEDFAALEILNVGWNRMTELDLSSNINLKDLKFNYSRYLQTLNLSNNPNLERIRSNETALMELDLSACYGLKELILGEPSPGDNSGIAMLDLSNSPHLEKLQLINNVHLEKVDLRSGNNLGLIDVFVDCSVDGGYRCEPIPCFMVDDSEAARNNQFPYSEWDADVVYSEGCALGVSSGKPGDFIIVQNPAGDKLYLKSAGNMEKSLLQIFNPQGKLLSNFAVHNGSDTVLDVSHLVPGIYFLKIKSAEFAAAKKFVKK